VKFKPEPDQIEALAEITRSHDMKKAVTADKARMVAERKAHVDRIKMLNTEGTATWPKAQRVIVEAAAKVREAERRLRGATDALAAANANAKEAYTWRGKAKRLP
jgi:hypothetical protein